MPINEKYARKIWNASGSCGIVVDVYAVLVAFGVTCPATAHAVKKLLCAGQRGAKDVLQDLTEAKQSIERAIELANSGADISKWNPPTEET